jgi:hypothetical protein
MEQVDALGRAGTLIHFTYEVGKDWRIACMPNMIEFYRTMYHPSYQRSNDTRAVTCSACKESPVFKKAQDAIDAVVKRGPIRGAQASH